MTRTGWRAGPIRPETAVLPERADPASLGRRTFALRWPRTRALLTGEFRLTTRQAWEVARTARRHRGLSSQRRRLIARLAAALLVVSPVLVVFAALPLWTAFIESTIRSTDTDRLAIWYAGIAAGLTLLVLVGWVLYERFGMDRLIDRQIRECWRDRVCLWCSQDMDDARPKGDRWAVCPECGMRSPIAVRTP